MNEKAFLVASVLPGPWRGRYSNTWKKNGGRVMIPKCGEDRIECFAVVMTGPLPPVPYFFRMGLPPHPHGGEVGGTSPRPHARSEASYSKSGTGAWENYPAISPRVSLVLRLRKPIAYSSLGRGVGGTSPPAVFSRGVQGGLPQGTWQGYPPVWHWVEARFSDKTPREKQGFGCVKGVPPPPASNRIMPAIEVIIFIFSTFSWIRDLAFSCLFKAAACNSP